MRVMQCKNYENVSAVSISPWMLRFSYVFAVAHLRLFLFFFNYFYYYYFFGARRRHFILVPDRAQELCESRGGRPGLPSLISLRFLWT